MKLRNKLIISHGVISVFLVIAMIFSYFYCETICGANHSMWMMNRSMNIFIASAFGALSVTFIFSILFANKLSEPIRIITAKTGEIASGKYGQQITIRSGTTEVDALIDGVNNLAVALGAQQTLKKRMASDYSHEFRTPLAAIQSNLEGIIDGVFEATNERIESIRQEILRLCRMVDGIDKIAELQNDSVALKKERFNFCELLIQNLNTFEAEIKEKNIKLTLNAEPCYICADKDKISSVILNLISNAVKYTDTNGKIDIVVKDKNSIIIFTVSDTGMGISGTDLPHIFEHLYRADVSRARNTGGSGIGLSVTKAIVDAHDGSITVESKINKGSRFTVCLPKE